MPQMLPKFFQLIKSVLYSKRTAEPHISFSYYVFLVSIILGQYLSFFLTLIIFKLFLIGMALPYGPSELGNKWAHTCGYAHAHMY